MTTLEKLNAASPEVREAVLALLDDMSRPLSPRELDAAFCADGLSRSKARQMTRALKGLTIVAVVREP